MKKILNPWKIPALSEEDYSILRKQHKLKQFNFNLKNNPIFKRRGLIVGHERFDEWFYVAKKKRKVALVSGFMLSGNLHLGSLLVSKQMAYYQNLYNSKIFIPLADLEAMCVRKVTENKINEMLPSFLAHLGASGLNINDCKIYLQSMNINILREASLYTGHFDIRELNKIYGRQLNLGQCFSSLVMVADIIYPQLLSYEKTLVNLGIDEINHFLLTKELIKKINSRYHFPSITYHKMITGLKGSKMAKSKPENSILLSDSQDAIINKLNSLREKRLPLNKNTAFNILLWYHPDDNLVKQIEEEKNNKFANKIAIDHAIELVTKMLAQHQRRYHKLIPKSDKLILSLYHPK